MKVSRVEAITDGIIAIAATIMVLEMGVPSTNDWRGLLEVRHTFLTYLISFLMIYIVWSMHHDLFQQAKTMSRRTFLVNGIWTFFLTLVPFTTAWVGSAPEAFLPEFIYPLCLLLWSASFQWLEYQMRKDNPGLKRIKSLKLSGRLMMYGSSILCMGLACIMPILSINVIGGFTVIMFLWAFFDGGTRKEKREEQEAAGAADEQPEE